MEYFIFYCLAALICALVSLSAITRPLPLAGTGKFWILLSLQHTKHKIHKSRVESSRAEPNKNPLEFFTLYFLYIFSKKNKKECCSQLPCPAAPLCLSPFALFAREICACLPFGMSARMLHGFRRDLFCCATATATAPVPSRPLPAGVLEERQLRKQQLRPERNSPSRTVDTQPVLNPSAGWGIRQLEGFLRFFSAWSSLKDLNFQHC